MSDVVVLAAGVGSVAGPGVRVALACEVVPELLVAAAAGVADAVVLGASLPGLDREVLARLHASGTAVVGLAGTEEDERRLRRLGVGHVRPFGAQDLAMAIAAAVDDLRATGPLPGFAHASRPERARPEEGPAPAAGAGQVLAVWGPTGAPGRTTVAVSLAAELALVGWPVLLVDADPYGGAVATALGLPDEASSLAAACRAANLGVLDAAGLTGLVTQRGPRLDVLSGVVADRWPELRPTALHAVLGVARSVAAVTVVDCGFCLEQDEELSYDTLAPRRNGATLTALEQADVVVAVGTGDRVGMPRLVRGLHDLGSAVGGGPPLVVVNRVREGSDEQSARDALRRLSGVEHLTAVPEDAAACDAARRGGVTLAEAAAGSPARLALRGLAASLVG